LLGIVAISATKTKESYPTPRFRQKEVTRSKLEEKKQNLAEKAELKSKNIY
jgi:hypothetical protein